ncbi:hypothetical protein [Neptunitalea lumnitzerae]|nr:hypothetical protein [Neptunitalea sp. Y10]
MNFLRASGQLVFIVLYILIGKLVFQFKIPGYKIVTDGDEGFIAFFYFLLIVLGLGLLLNSYIFLLKGHWKKFRIAVMLIVFVLALVFGVPSKVVNSFYFGEQVSTYSSIQNEDLIWTDIKLFENHKFLYSSSLGGEIMVENIGTYEMKNNSLKLFFENKQFDYREEYYKVLYENIGTEYTLDNDTLVCENCKSDIQLIKR